MNFDIIAAYDDPNIFAPWFKDPETWIAWRTLTKAIFGIGMTPHEWAIYRECTNRDDMPTGFDECWAITGRRGGKSLIMALIAVYLATFRDYRQYLQPGERATLPIIASDRKQARNIFRYVRGALTGVPILAQMIESETAESIDLTNQVTIEVATASYKGARGYTLCAAVCDEVAFWANEESRNPDEAILAAIRPGMSTIPGAKLLCVTSPYAKRGEAYENYKRFYGKSDADVLVWQAASRRMNPTLKQSIVDRAMEKDPAAAASEYMGQWREDLQSFVSRQIVEACVENGVHERPFVSGRKYKAFCDPSGGSSDSFTLVIAHMENEVTVIDVLREIPAPFSPPDAVKELTSVLKAYRLKSVVGDRYAGEWVVSAFRANGIRYEHSELNRSEIYLEFLPLLNSRKVKLLDHPKTINQICNLERRTARSGKDSIDHPPGSHDDAANSVAGAATLITAAPKNTVTSMSWEEMGHRSNPDNYWTDPATGERKYLGTPARFIAHPGTSRGGW